MICIPWSCESTVKRSEICFWMKSSDTFVVGVSGPSDVFLWYVKVFSNSLYGDSLGRMLNYCSI